MRSATTPGASMKRWSGRSSLRRARPPRPSCAPSPAKASAAYGTSVPSRRCGPPWPVISATPRLCQLFGRYATYCGSSPYLAPATLMLVAHVEQQGVFLVEGGMHRVAQSMARLAVAKGASFRYGATVAEICVAAGRTTAVRLASGERIDADAVVVNADASALSAGLFGRNVAQAMPPPAGQRSLSAMTWAMVAEADGFPLVRHTVFFSRDYKAEFEAIARGSLPSEPTIYLCSQDRTDVGTATSGPGRFLCLINAPATGDTNPLPQSEITACADRVITQLQRYGLHLRPRAAEATTPSGFNTLFPATGGALYGQATHGPMASFARPGSRTAIPGLYLAGGQCASGAGGADGSAVGAPGSKHGCWRTSLRLARPAWWLLVVVCRRAERRWRTRHYAHCLHRQRLFPLLRVVSPKGGGGPAPPLRA